LVFITETECVYCAVRAESLNTTPVHFRLYRIKAVYNIPWRDPLWVLSKLSVYSQLNSLQRMRQIQLYFAVQPTGRVLWCWQRRGVTWVASS